MESDTHSDTFETDYSVIFPYRYKKLEPKPFEDMDVSTRTFIAKLETNIDLRLFFIHSEVCYVEQPVIKRKKIKIKHVGPPGAILSICYNGKYKGIQTRVNPKPFLNQASIIMSIKTKNVNFKIFNNGVIQATGCKTKEDERDVIKYIIQHGKDIEKKLNVVIFENEPKMCEPLSVMINVDFKLGFNIDREELNNNINKLNDFDSTFNDQLPNSCVTVTIERRDKNGLVYNTKKRQKDSFLCFHSGTVLLSGNDLKYMEEIYNKFYNTIAFIKPKIVTSQKSMVLEMRKLNIVFGD